MKRSILALALLPMCAHAVDIEIGTGVTHYKTAHDGLWYQESFPHWIDANDTPLSIGVSHEIRGLRYRAEFLSLGWIYSSAQWTADSTYYAGAPAPATAYGIGRGSASGLVLSVSRPVNIFGLPFYGEAGGWIYIPKWKISVYDMSTGAHICECETPTDKKIGPVLGFGIRHNGIDVGIRYMGMPTTGTDTPPIYNHAYTLMAKVYF